MLFKLIGFLLLMLSASAFAINPPLEPDDPLHKALFEELTPEEQAKALKKREEIKKDAQKLLVFLLIGFALYILFKLFRKGKFDRWLEDKHAYSWLRHGDPIEYLIVRTAIVSLEFKKPDTFRAFSYLIAVHNLVISSLLAKKKIKNEQLIDVLLNYAQKIDYQKSYLLSENTISIDTEDVRYQALKKEFEAVKKILSENYSFYDKFEKQLEEYMSKTTIKFKF